MKNGAVSFGHKAPHILSLGREICVTFVVVVAPRFFPFHFFLFHRRTEPFAALLVKSSIPKSFTNDKLPQDHLGRCVLGRPTPQCLRTIMDYNIRPRQYNDSVNFDWAMINGSKRQVNYITAERTASVSLPETIRVETPPPAVPPHSGKFSVDIGMKRTEPFGQYQYRPSNISI